MASSRNRDRAVIAPETLTINDYGNADLSASYVTSDLSSSVQALTTQDLLTLLLTEIRITNAHLAEIVGCEVTFNDVE